MGLRCLFRLSDLLTLRVLDYVRVFGSHDSPENIINCYKPYTIIQITKQFKRQCKCCTHTIRTFFCPNKKIMTVSLFRFSLAMLETTGEARRSSIQS